MREVVNLYMVMPDKAEYCYFVFASSHNKARALCVNHFTDDESYIDMRAYLKRKNVGGENNVVVDSPEDRHYKRVLDLGCEYIKDEDNCFN